jgi:zinc/manganese transport system ATP-binding protein
MRQGDHSVPSIATVAGEPSPLEQRTAPIAHPAAETVVHINRACVRLGGRTIWHDVTMTVGAGEFIAVLGPNGAGKSTLIKAILGLVPLSEGTISVLGAPARRGNRALGYVPQRRTFGPDVHVRGRDLVALGLTGARWGVPLPGLRRIWGGDALARQEREQIERMIAAVGATDYADRPIGELSGGEQQRLLIAQALVTQPRLLLLDEPLDSLDLRNQQEVSGVIRRISDEQGTAVLLVAHDVNPILPYLDRVCYIAQGHTAIGTPEQVITTETLSQLYGASVEVLRTRDGRLIVVGQPEGVPCEGMHTHTELGS